MLYERFDHHFINNSLIHQFVSSLNAKNLGPLECFANSSEIFDSIARPRS